jgi:hypothetical protein
MDTGFKKIMVKYGMINCYFVYKQALLKEAEQLVIFVKILNLTQIGINEWDGLLGHTGLS